MAKEKMKRKQAVIERQEEELESREQSLEGAAADSHHATQAFTRLQQEAKTLKVSVQGLNSGEGVQHTIDAFC